MNQWEKEFGRRRRQIDRELLAEAERQIAALEDVAPCSDAHLAPKATQTPKNSRWPPTLNQDACAAIARALGLPL